MAFTPTATVVQTSPLPDVANDPVTYLLTIANAGSTAANVVSLQPIVRNANGQPSNAITPQVAIPIGTSVQVGATSSWSFPFTVLLPGPQCPGAPAQGNGLYLVDCICSTSDGSVFSVAAPPILAVTTSETAQQSALPVVGQLTFTTGLNSALWYGFV